MLPALLKTLATRPVCPGEAEAGDVMTGAGVALTATVTVGALIETQPLASVTVSV